MGDGKTLMFQRLLRWVAVSLAVSVCPVNVGLASPITLGASLDGSVQIKALAASLWEIQLGGCWNQGLPASTKCQITGAANAVIGGTSYSGFYSLSTLLLNQLQMRTTALGSRPGDSDRYAFVSPNHDKLTFKFGSDLSFANPWLNATITNVSATQKVPCTNCAQNDPLLYPSLFILGNIGVPTGTLASFFPGGADELTLDLGGNQRISDLKPPNSYSGMKLQGGTITPVPEPSALLLLGGGLFTLAGMARRRVRRS